MAPCYDCIPGKPDPAILQTAADLLDEGGAIRGPNVAVPLSGRQWRQRRHQLGDVGVVGGVGGQHGAVLVIRGQPPAELVDHTWVQVAFGADWLDLDPTMSASDPGTVLTSAAETLDRLPDDLRHRVEFEVLVERVSGEQLVTDPVLEYSAFADQVTDDNNRPRQAGKGPLAGCMDNDFRTNPGRIAHGDEKWFLHKLSPLVRGQYNTIAQP